MAAKIYVPPVDELCEGVQVQIRWSNVVQWCMQGRVQVRAGEVVLKSPVIQYSFIITTSTIPVLTLRYLLLH